MNTSTNAPTPQINWDDLESAVEQLKKPVPVAIWFVDRKDIYNALMTLVPVTNVSLVLLAGIPVYCVSKPCFLNGPGVWAQMSDGSYCKIPIVIDHT